MVKFESKIIRMGNGRRMINVPAKQPGFEVGTQVVVRKPRIKTLQD